MKRILAALAAPLAIAACDGNPFVAPPAPTPPATPATSEVYSLQVNSLTYDETNDELVINNLPFDGPDGTYTRVLERTEIDGFNLYQSTQTDETGRRQYYALFRRTDSGHGEVGVVATGDYADFGFGGTLERRNNGTTVLPSAGEYVYTGDYAGLRTASDRGGIEMVDGDVLLEVDIADFDETGAVEGRVSNRTRYSITGVPLSALPSIVFRTASISDGVITGGTVVTNNSDGTVRDEGTYTGLFVGPNGEEIVGSVNMTGDFIVTNYTEAVPGTDPDGNPITTDVALSYSQYLAIQAAAAAGDPTAIARLAAITVTEETIAGSTVREIGVFTAVD